MGFARVHHPRVSTSSCKQNEHRLQVGLIRDHQLILIIRASRARVRSKTIIIDPRALCIIHTGNHTVHPCMILQTTPTTRTTTSISTRTRFYRRSQGGPRCRTTSTWPVGRRTAGRRRWATGRARLEDELYVWQESCSCVWSGFPLFVCYVYLAGCEIIWRVVYFLNERLLWLNGEKLD